MEWKCFHCGDVFTNEQCARLHFGRDEESVVACLIKGGAEQGLLSALRDAEYEAADARNAIANECTDAAKAYYGQMTRHNKAIINAEELGYAKGIADGIHGLLSDVRQFHEALAPELIAPSPRLQPPERANGRADWLVEEAEELRVASTIYDQADAYIDSIYFAIGGLVDLGIDPQPLWNIVHGANMAKIWPDGTVRRRDDGKVLKPPAWVDPTEALQEEVNRQIGVGK